MPHNDKRIVFLVSCGSRCYQKKLKIVTKAEKGASFATGWEIKMTQKGYRPKTCQAFPENKFEAATGQQSF